MSDYRTQSDLVQWLNELDAKVAQIGTRLAGLGQGETVTPALANVTLGTGGTNTQRWSRVGRMVFVSGSVVLGSGGALTGDPMIALPTPAEATTIGALRCLDSSAGTATFGACFASASQVVVRVPAGAPSATVPFTWAASDSIFYSVTYEAAT